MITSNQLRYSITSNVEEIQNNPRSSHSPPKLFFY
jgi:hypothetical protein